MSCYTAVWTPVCRRVMRLRVVLRFCLDVYRFRVSTDSLKSAVKFDRLPRCALHSWGCFGAVFILAFFPCACDL